VLQRETIEAILFDLDGTLIDTDDQAVEALARRLRRIRWPHPKRAARRLIMASETPGNALVTALDMLGLDAPLRALTDRLRRWRGLLTPADFRIVVGVDEALATLSQQYRLAVVTTRGRVDAEAFLAQYGLASLFESVVTSESTWRLKPHPAPVRYAARQLELAPERCVMVGDTTVDVRSGRRAGAQTVGVLCGFGERGELERAGADLVLETTADLGSVLGSAGRAA